MPQSTSSSPEQVAEFFLEFGGIVSRNGLSPLYGHLALCIADDPD